ncbi:MAG: hypothetical protein NWQ07_04505 [Flaviramulus sp.]|nr:hypothetical protein [Flaviramulus sp.]
MKVLKQLFNFYIDSSIHVAFSVVSLTWITLLEFEIPFDFKILLFVLSSSITGYNFVKYFGVAKFHHRSLANRLRYIQFFSFLSFILMSYFIWQLQSITLLYILAFGIITFLYAIPFLPKRFYIDSQHNLRNIGGLKIYLIALVWTGVTVFLPLIENSFSLNDDVFLTAIQRFILIIVLMLPFEIRDLRYDSLKLATIPQKIGVRQTKIMGSLLLGMFFLLELFKNQTTYIAIIILVLITSLTLIFLLFSKTEQRKYYSAFWVEGLPIFWLILLFLFY